MNGSSSIHHNTAANGGGVSVNSGTTPGMSCGTNVHDNTPNDCLV